MPQEKTLSEIISSGVTVEAGEAVAIVQQLIAALDDLVESPVPPGPLLPDNILIADDGTARCPACGTSPSIFEIGCLLQTLLPPHGAARVPGALRYAIARALLEVDAAPFDSIAEFSGALRRHEKADRPILVRQLFARADSTESRARPVAEGRRDRPSEEQTAAVVVEDRRRRAPSIAELRRQLREADEERYRLLVKKSDRSTPAPLQIPLVDPDIIRPTVVHVEIPPPSWNRPRRGRWRWALGGTTAVLLAFAAGYFSIARLPLHSRSAPPQATASADGALAPGQASPSPLRTSGAAPIPQPSSGDEATNDPSTRKRDDRSSSGPGPSILRVMSKAAGPAFSPSFGPAGAMLFFHTGHTASEPSALEAVDLEGGEDRPRAIVNDGARNYHVKPSPSGDRIAYDSDRGGERGVYIASADGTDPRRVSGPGHGALPTWSPDGTRLAFVRAEPGRPRVWNLWLLTIDTGAMRRLTGFKNGQTWSASWFADGERISYAHEDRLFIRNVATGAVQSFASPVSGRQLRTPAVSPDGRHVVFQVFRDGAWMLDVPEGTTRRILADPTAEEFAWSPDGRRVAFHSRRDGQWGIWAMTPA